MEQTPSQLTAAVVRAELARRKIRGGDLAVVLGLSRTTMWRRLNGEHPFDVDELTAVAKHLGLSTAELLPDEPAGTPERVASR
jgi:transcriptional regulator with XRE-family HTH domain